MVRALGCAAAVGGVLGVSALLLGPQLLGIYSDSSAVTAAGMNRLRIVCALYAICGLMDVIVGSVRGIGFAVTPMLISLIGACGLRIPLGCRSLPDPGIPHHPHRLHLLSRLLDHHLSGPADLLLPGHAAPEAPHGGITGNNAGRRMTSGVVSAYSPSHIRMVSTPQPPSSRASAPVPQRRL